MQPQPKMPSAAALFSGKDSIYAILKAESAGIHVKELISMITTFKQPSPHMENIGALSKAAERMRKKLTIVDLHKREGELVRVLKESGAEALVAGDVLMEEHVKWLEEVCSKAGMGLIEPLYRESTENLLREMLDEGFIVKIIGVDTKLLDEKWLGFILSEKNLKDFITGIGNADPLGENGEYHTLVLDCPLYSSPLEVRSSVRIQSGSLKYLRVEVA